LRRGIRAWKNTVDGSERNQKPVNPISLEQMIPESSSNPLQNIPDSVDSEVAEVAHVAKLAQEGGEEFISYMLARAFPLNGMDTPNTFRELQRMSPSTQKLWKDACKEELNHLRERGVIELTDLPNGFTPLDNRWVFLQKSDGRLRSRLVVKGFKQVEGIDYNEIFSPVVRYETIRVIFALSALEGWHMEALDVVAAFLYGDLKEELYMKQPEGFIIPGKERQVLRLRKALYGLKQASLSWWRALSKSLKKFGFKRIVSDAGIFVYREGKHRVIAVVYVDDILLLGSSRDLVLAKKREFMAKWECRDLPVAEFLSMRIQIDKVNRTVTIDQTSYCKKVLSKLFDKVADKDKRPARTPLPANYRPEPNSGEATPQLRRQYQSVIGSLLYLMIGTRPDIAYAVSKMAQYSANPSEDHLKNALHIGRYLIGTQDYALTYNGAENEGLIFFTDSDWGTDPFDRRSVSGYFAKLAGGAIFWVSHAQKTMALSSTDAEYMALSDTG
jgi:hypothetical protein